MRKFAICLSLLLSILASQSQATAITSNSETLLQGHVMHHQANSKLLRSFMNFGPGVGGDPSVHFNVKSGPGVGGDPAFGPGVGGAPSFSQAQGPGVGGDPR